MAYAEAEKVLHAVPDDWARINGRWVQLEKPVVHRLPYDMIEADWKILNEALMDGRLRVVPVGTFCVCDDDKTCAMHAEEG